MAADNGARRSLADELRRLAERPPLTEELHELVAPIRTRLEEIEADLADVDRIRNQLRVDRDDTRKALRAVDPTFEADSRPGKAKGGKRKGRTARGTYGVGEETLAEMAELMRQHAADFDGEGFTATSLARLPGWRWGAAHTSQAVRAMHDRGTIRLDHTGTGGGRWYALV